MFITHEIEGTLVLQNEALLEAGLPHGWFGVALGNTMYRPDYPPEEIAAVQERWTRGCELLGMTAARLTRATGLLQTDKVLYVPEEKAGQHVGEADGYVLDTPGLPLMMRAADCTQSVLFDPRTNILGVVHAGGLGMANGALPATVMRMIAKGSDPRNMIVGIGPAISAQHFVPTYEKDNFTLNDIREHNPATQALPDGRIGYDIVETGRQQLLGLGIPEQNIAISGIDTFASPDFFSSERDQSDPVAAKAGARHALFVALAA